MEARDGSVSELLALAFEFQLSGQDTPKRAPSLLTGETLPDLRVVESAHSGDGVTEVRQREHPELG